MNKQEAEAFVYKSYLKAEKHQNYNTKDSGKRRPELLRKLIREQSGTPCVVITGSKGKGSAAAMISGILQSAYKVGLMTSPHITDFCERFQVNGCSISDQEFAFYMSQIQPKLDEIDAEIPKNACISPMGIQTLLGLRYFHAKHTDFNVLECGKGARYDDVNQALHQYAVINSIFLEHTRELGAALEEIAYDKSHVITGEQKCVYLARQSKEVLSVIQKRADAFQTPVKYYGRDFFAERIRYTNRGMRFDVVIGKNRYRDLTVPLLGGHQAENCALAMAVCQDISGDFNLADVKRKLLELNWPGRMEVLSSDPLILLDACIHSASCKNVKDVMRHLGMKQAVIIIGIPDDKDYAGVAKAMQDAASAVILTKSQNPHYVFTPIQQERLLAAGIPAIWTDSVKESLKRAKLFGRPIVILGTTSVISEVKKLKEF